MCGIAGIVAADAGRLEVALAAMVAAQVHRGPDDEGTFLTGFGRGFLGLGHRRLSILDLSRAGHQPMIHPGTGDVLVYNGEIYNFRSLRAELEGCGERFQSTSDTEVLLHALARWGAEALERLEGMYGLAFYRRSENKVLLARDPIGIKPLYWARTPSALLFASEVRAILASGMVAGAHDLDAVAGMLAYGSVQEPLTVFREIRSVPAGCWVEVSPDHDRVYRTGPVTRHWAFPDIAPTGDREAVARTREVVEAAVASHLVSDVPVGVFLSSGLDSTVVTALARKTSDRLQTFTVDFTDNRDYGEAGLARETARRFGVGHTTIDLSAEHALAAVPDWLAALDQPSLDGLNTYVISRAVRGAGIVVALSGQGGDELFGGYPSFADVPSLWRKFRLARRLPRGLRRQAARALSIGRPRAWGDKLQDMAATGGDLRALYLQRRRNLSNRQMRALGFRESDAAPGFMPAPEIADCRIDPADPIATVSRLETRYYLGNTLLRVGDESGMANSLEIRVPMLDRRVLDAVLACPGPIRLPDARPNKHLLRQAFAEHLRPEPTAQGKRGFVLPVARWMGGPLRELCERALGALRHSGMVDPEGVDAVWRAYLAEPETPIWSRAWTLCVLGAYLDRPAVR